MRIIKRVALIGAILIIIGCLIIYRIADYTLYLQEDSVRHFQSLIPQKSEKYFELKSGSLTIKESPVSYQTEKRISEMKTCKKPLNDIVVDIQMSSVYDSLKFDNIDGGVWKQGWNIQTDPARWNSTNKLKVFIVPHSHNDPGWIKTFEDYYNSETQNILNNMLKKLTSDPKKKFIWAEISYFSLWWDGLSKGDQIKVKRLLSNGQLEIVTGGWVMNDEANTHYYSMVTQLTEGHQWMKANVGLYPKNGWTIDPFGESPVMPYLLNKMGLQSLVIQRVHYSVKKYFAHMKNLEFRWRQFWDEYGTSDLLTHMTPFYSYDIPHTCGPDPKICCQFDFKRLPGSGVSCPWKEPPKIITKKNVALRSQMLLDQYRKKSMLYKTNVLLVPLGDDFRYQYSAEWDNQFENYYKLMDYINSKPALYAEIKFGTLAEYFEALIQEQPINKFPTLTGDFFTYADRDDHYWSGYYTSRPWYKRMDRVLIGYQRAAEILFALGWSMQNSLKTNWLLAPQTGFAKKLRDARRSLSLFQHHDGITGTARDNVMEDYARKMLDAIFYSQHVMQQVTHFLMSPTDQQYFHDSEQVYFEFDDRQKHTNDLPEKQVLDFEKNETKTLVFFNSLGYKRKELASILVVSPYVEVRNSEGIIIPHQVNPTFASETVMDDSCFEIVFMVEIPALTLASYYLMMKTSIQEPHKNVFSKVKVFNAPDLVKNSEGFKDFETERGHKFSIENKFMSVTFGENGLLKSVTNKQTMELIPVHLDFVSYGARRGKERSGAYLFLPEGEASVMKVASPIIKVFEGPICSRVQVKLSNIKHSLTLNNFPGLENLGLEITNVVDISSENNYELAMRLTSHIKSDNHFYTDLNGFQMIKRKKYSKLPIQGNFYPMPSAAYIEDEKTRLTILSAQPLGVSSLRSGEIEVLQDRRLNQDDERGLGQGVLDNRLTPNSFRILIERRLENCNIIPSLLSSNALISSQSLLNPLIKMIRKKETRSMLRNFYMPTASDLSSDVHLLTVRTFDEEVKPYAGLVFHRSHVDFCFVGSQSPGDGVVNIKSFLPEHFGDEMQKTTLSFLKEITRLNKNEDQILCNMEFLAVTLS